MGSDLEILNYLEIIKVIIFAQMSEIKVNLEQLVVKFCIWFDLDGPNSLYAPLHS